MHREHQISMVSLDQLVLKNHQYRKFKVLFNFEAVKKDLLSVILTIRGYLATVSLWKISDLRK